MSEMTEFKRMNFFTGFFTTADDWKAEQEYHRLKLGMHNRGLHTPGILRGIGSELNVTADAAGNVLVQPGMALDSEGNEIYLGLPRTLPVTALTEAATVYVTIACGPEKETDPVTNIKMPEYSGNTRLTEVADIKLGTNLPDNRKILELARIVLPAGTASVSNPADPAAPGTGEIDRRHAVYAGSVGVTDGAQWLDPDLLARLNVCMATAREEFRFLMSRFPVPSCDDVRQGALTIQLLACTGAIRRESLAGLLTVLASVEHDVGQEVDAAYPGLSGGFPEYSDYVDAVNALRQDLKTVPDNPDLWLTGQDKVSLAAQKLAQIVLAIPVADAGNAQAVSTMGDEAKVSLDASASHAFGGRSITAYRWNLKSSSTLPVASPGVNRTVMTPGTEATVSLDASGSTAADGADIVKYTWNKKNVIIPL